MLGRAQQLFPFQPWADPLLIVTTPNVKGGRGNQGNPRAPPHPCITLRR